MYLPESSRVSRDGDGTFSAEEAEFAKETNDREDEQARAIQATTGEGLASSGKDTGGTSTTTVASPVPSKTVDALHEMDELISSLMA